MSLEVIIPIILIIIVIYVLCCPSDEAMIIIISAQIFSLLFCLFMRENKKSSNQTSETFYNPTKILDDDKFDIYHNQHDQTPRDYDELVHELKKINYDIGSENYDNGQETLDYELDGRSGQYAHQPMLPREEDIAEEMIQTILDENREDVTVDYGASSLGIELSKRNKQAINIRSRFTSENFKEFHEEELDEADNRVWYDRDLLELDF